MKSVIPNPGFIDLVIVVNEKRITLPHRIQCHSMVAFVPPPCEESQHEVRAADRLLHGSAGVRSDNSVAAGSAGIADSKNKNWGDSKTEDGDESAVVVDDRNVLHAVLATLQQLDCEYQLAMVLPPHLAYK